MLYFLPGMLLQANGTLWVDLDDADAQAYLLRVADGVRTEPVVFDQLVANLAHLGVRRARAFRLSSN